MRRIIINDAHLKDEDMDYEVIRAKGLIINSKKEIILVENNNTYQFPGGHYKKNESLEETLSREIREELGINILIDTGPFMMITTYDNNYFGTGDKVLNKIYYYIIYTDLEPNLNNLKLDALESKTEFKLFRIKLEELHLFLINALDKGKINPSIEREMLLVDSIFKELFNK